MSKFNLKKETNKTINLAGGKSISMNPKQELVHAVLTTFLEDKYYEKGDDRISRIQELIRNNDPVFVAKLSIYARTVFNLRSVSHLLLGELSKIHKGDDLVKRSIIYCAIRPDDLTEIMSYVGKPVPKQVKRGIRNALLKFNRHQLAKYKGENNKLKLVDLFNLVHPKAQFANEEQKLAWKDLMEGKLASTDTWESEISKNPSKESWEKLIVEKKIGYMALLRNLNNLIKYKVSDECMDIVVSKLTDLEEVKRSRQLPFRFYTAYENVKGNRKLSDAVSLAMDIAVSNTPELLGKTLIAVDSSGSMSSCMDKAGVFGATLLKSNVNSDVILYDTRVKEFAGSGRTPVVDLTRSIVGSAMGGGTETSLVFRYAYTKFLSGVTYDRVIIISDNESWAEGWNSSVQGVYNEYKKLTSTDPFVYAIDIQGYGTKDVESPKVTHLCGWSEKLLNFIGEKEKGNSLVKEIEDVKI